MIFLSLLSRGGELAGRRGYKDGSCRRHGGKGLRRDFKPNLMSSRRLWRRFRRPSPTTTPYGLGRSHFARWVDCCWKSFFSFLPAMTILL
uniref:Uncharacterized protein n=1 Tax=Utricularia reniformis TaxID=192314 RepID=A0A1Y0B3I6_9LAMI|nr:hypothetical protein AEK19_MT1785 [Utricularia reniformis]ART31958.1 hypothetical protein AEK19_MT1785 [Utricularia reniformis]